MVHVGRRRRPNGPGIWVGGPLLFFYFVLPSVFFSSSLIRASIAWVGVDGFALYHNPFFLCSFLLVPFLGIAARKLRMS